MYKQDYDWSKVKPPSSVVRDLHKQGVYPRGISDDGKSLDSTYDEVAFSPSKGFYLDKGRYRLTSEGQLVLIDENDGSNNLRTLFNHMLWISEVCEAVDVIRKKSVPKKYMSYISYEAACFTALWQASQDEGIDFVWLSTVSKANPGNYAKEFERIYLKLCEAKECLDDKGAKYLPYFKSQWGKLIAVYNSGDWNRNFELVGTPNDFKKLREKLGEVCDVSALSDEEVFYYAISSNYLTAILYS